MGPMGPMMGGPMGHMRPPMYPGGGGHNPPSTSTSHQSGPTRPLFPAASQAASVKVKLFFFAF